MSQRALSLRRRLQSTSLLAVLAGYVLLLGVNHGLSALQRRHAHQQLLAELQDRLSGQATDRAGLEALLARQWLPSLRLALLPAQGAMRNVAYEEIFSGDGQTWLVSRLSVPLVSGARTEVLVRENISLSLQRERLSQLLLMAAAGVSSLVTSALLRPVMRRGLVQPLAGFAAQLRVIQAPSTFPDALDVAAQPEELRPIADAFNALQQRLQRSWEQQRSFVDGVAHELRTPITLISGHTQSLLRRDSRDPALQLIRAESERMGSLVRDLLDLARQDSGRLTLQVVPIEAEDALLTLHERLSPHAAGRLLLPCQMQELQGLADPDRLQQCLTALVDNALLYSPAGSPVQLACSRGPAGELVLHVQDRGPGVALEEREVIFERFVRGRAAQHSDQRGSGIGLSVVQLLMTAMGGCVVVADAPGGGADFQLWLSPAKPSPALPSA